MAKFIAQVACTVPGGVYYPAGAVVVADTAPCKHFQELSESAAATKPALKKSARDKLAAGEPVALSQIAGGSPSGWSH